MQKREQKNHGVMAHIQRSPIWSEYTLLFLITLLAAALRFFRLGEWSFWIDEIFTVNHAINHFSSLALILDHIPPARNWIPVSTILTAQVLSTWGVNELNARLVAAFIGIITIPIFYFLIQKIFGSRVALITVLLLSVSPWHIEWSQNARGYTALMLFYTLALLSFYYWLEKDKIWFLILFFVFLYLGSSERMLALFILPAVGLYLLVLWITPVEKPKGLRLRNILILLSPGILFLITQLFQLAVTGNSIAASIVEEIISTFVGNPIENPAIQMTFMIFKVGIPLFIVSFAGAIYLIWQKNRHGILFVLGSWIPFAIVVCLTPFMFTEERYAFISLPGFLVLSAVIIDSVLEKLRDVQVVFAIAILVALVVDAMGANILYFHTNHGNRRNWKAAFQLVSENMRSGDLVVSTWPELGNYYLKQDVELWQDVKAEEIQKGNDRVWFVVIPDMAWYTGTEDLYWWVAHYTRMIKTQYLRTVDDTNIEIYLYDPELKSIFQPLK